MRTSTEGSLYRLLTWLSPSYPVGAYSFSHGLEFAVETGQIHNREAAFEWIRDLLRYGNGRADLVFLKEAWNAAGESDELAAVATHALAFQTSSELRTESTAQGRAFADITLATWPAAELEETLARLGSRVAYPVVVGITARAHEVSRQDAMLAYAHAFVSNLVSAAVRLVPLGQTDGQQLIASLEADVEAAVSVASTLTRYTVSNATIMSDIASMKHETQYTRLFRS